MSYKKIYSRGGFGVEKTDKNSGDFSSSKSQNIIGRVVDLSRIRPGVLGAPEAKRILQKRGPKKKTIFEKRDKLKSGSAELYKKFFIGWSRFTEPLEIPHPDRDEILATLEEIDALSNSLKNQTWSEAADEKLELIEPRLETPEMIDVEKYLWLEEAPAVPMSEPDILTELLAEPDLAAVESRTEIENNSIQPSLKLRRGEGGVMFDAQGELILPADKTAQSDLFARWRQRKDKAEEEVFILPERKTRNRQGVDSIWNRPVRLFTRQFAGFISAGFLIYLVIFGLSLAGRGLSAKENILGSALQAYQAMLAAKDSAVNLNFDSAGANFESAYQNFLIADQELNKMGRGIIYVLEKLPGGAVVGSGAALVDAGENLAKAGQSFARIGELFLAQKIGDYFSGQGPTLTQKIVDVQGEIAKAQTALAAADKSLGKVDPAGLPSDVAPQVQELKDKIAPAVLAVNQIKNWSGVFLEFLGHERAKKYLLVFQNNSEARPTGGFIGTYGVADIDEGQLKNLFIDGIFDLDGQLYEKIVPPRPIQKISTAWSTHDANWFADFPTSAKKIMNFYEKAGGATVDGVISMTPTVIEHLLAVTGPIEMAQYSTQLDQNNFLDVTQYKVEVDYDKAQNEPKKILADFAPLFLDKLWQVWPDKGQEIVKILADSLAEKHILFYFTNPELEEAFVEQGWTGEIISTEKDYLSVINTNINGFKTDKVIDQKIYHTANVQSDGSVVDTVKIVRTHQGGTSQYDWYNKVNADYLRVYVPLGSRLISADGQTLEAYSAPIDYVAQGFKADADVLAQESSTQIDPASGTQVFTESDKTVFGNWAFVSPGETVEITYQYLLPFKIDLNQGSASYSLLAQKQAGSKGSEFSSILQLPESVKIIWQYPASLEISGNQIKFSDSLLTDKFYGLVLTK